MGNCADDLGKLLIQSNTLAQHNNATPFNEQDRISLVSDTYDEYTNIQIANSEYRQMDIPEKNYLFYVCCNF